MRLRCFLPGAIVPECQNASLKFQFWFMLIGLVGCNLLQPTCVLFLIDDARITSTDLTQQCEMSLCAETGRHLQRQCPLVSTASP